MWLYVCVLRMLYIVFVHLMQCKKFRFIRIHFWFCLVNVFKLCTSEFVCVWAAADLKINSRLCFRWFFLFPHRSFPISVLLFSHRCGKAGAEKLNPNNINLISRSGLTVHMCGEWVRFKLLRWTVWKWNEIKGGSFFHVHTHTRVG